jgi:hypothetical protein
MTTSAARTFISEEKRGSAPTTTVMRIDVGIVGGRFPPLFAWAASEGDSARCGHRILAMR